MKKLIAVPVVIAIASGCAGNKGQGPDTIPPPPGEWVASDLPRDTDPNVSDTELEALVAGNNRFAFDLYQTVVAEEEGNVFYSPHSITMAMAMAWGGARTGTSDEMASTLNYAGAETHTAMNKLDLELASRGDGAKGADGKEFRLNVVNATFGQNGYPFEDEYLDLLAVNYGAGMALLDFRADPDGGREVINQWVEDATEDRIEDLIPPGVITQLTRLVLTNAIYFNAQWKDVFSTDVTAPGPFHLLNDSTVEVDLMHNRAHYGYAVMDGLQAVELPYDGEELSMVILLPDAGQFDAIEKTLNGDGVTTLLTQLESTDIQLTLPKWQYSFDLPLKRHLSEMGINLAFDAANADFTGINGGVEQLYISDVLHKAFVGVNEYGTEAAAATAVIIGTTSAPPEVKVDRPFIYLVRDIETGAVLFVGRVLDPS